jgi:hypothetical protein
LGVVLNNVKGNIMSNPTRLYSGLSTAYPNEPLYSYPFPDPFHTGSSQNIGSSTYVNDFNTLIGTDYTVTGTSSTFALASGIGGLATLTPGGATTATAAYKNGQFYQFVAGNRSWFVCRFKVSAVAGNVSFYVGLRNGSSATDVIWFAKAAASTSINLVSTVNSTATTLVTGVATAVADTFVEVGFYYDGTDLICYSGASTVDMGPDARVSAVTIGSSGTTLTNALLAPVFQITPTATDTLTTDFVLAAQEVSR